MTIRGSIMEELKCKNCSSPLRRDGDVYRCDYCGSVYKDDDEAKLSKKLQEMLQGEKEEYYYRAKRNMYNAAHEKYPSKEAVIAASREVLKLDDEDPLALVYLHSHDASPLTLIEILSTLQVDPYLAEEIVKWLIHPLSPRVEPALIDFCDRHFTNEKRTFYRTKIEVEMHSVKEGTYHTFLDRDVFLCYSSKDMPKVLKTLHTLESNGFECFAAFRNLRHGKGAAENYRLAIEDAMRHCKVLVFLSSNNSRDFDCDAMSVELTYLRDQLPEKERIEYILDDYGEETPRRVVKMIKSVFPYQEQCRTEDDLIDRVESCIVKTKQKETIAPKSAVEPKSQTRVTRKEETPVKAKPAEAIQRQETQKPQAKPAEKPHQAKGPIIYDDNVLYGEYPQSEVKDDIVIQKLKSMQKPANSSFFELAGRKYTESKGKYYLVEPIQWKIAKKENGKALLVSKIALDAHRYDEKKNRYETSEIRRFLTGQFFHLAFSSDSQSLRRVDEDIITLLSKEDVENTSIFPTQANRTCPISAYARSRGGSADNGCSEYWTCTGDSHFSSFAMCVNGNGEIFGHNVTLPYYGIRPKIWIDLD